MDNRAYGRLTGGPSGGLSGGLSGGGRFAALMLGMGVALVLLMVAAVCMGRYSMNPLDVVRVIASRLSGRPVDGAMEIILFRIRLPRVAAAVLIGAALSVSGAVYQSTFRNPLVSPDLLGVSSGASVGAALAILFGCSARMLPLCAFAGGMAAVLMSTGLARLLRNASNMILVLSGIIVSTFMGAIIGVVKFVSDEQEQLASIVFWQMGSLSKMNAGQLGTVALPTLVCLLLMVALSWRLNILSLDDQEAQTVGVNVPRLRALVVVCASLLTGCAVAVSGTIGWIGLVIPHFGRLICGSDNARVIPMAAILGGMFLLLIDTVARCATTMEIPLSILCGLIGAPFFAWLLSRSGRGGRFL